MSAVTLEHRLGVLLDAKEMGLLPAIRPHLDALVQSSFFISAALYGRALAEAGED